MAARSSDRGKGKQAPTAGSARSTQSGRVNDRNSVQPAGKAKSSSAYSREFERHLIDEGIFSYLYDDGMGRRVQRAKNHGEIIARLEHSQPLFMPPKFFKEYYPDVQDTLERARGETQVMTALAMVLKPDARITSRADQLFNNLAPLTRSNLTQAKPDMFDGALPVKIHPLIRQELGQYIQPSKKADELMVPNFFLEGKADSGDDLVVIRQALYNGALGARAMHQLRCFGLPDSANAFTGEAETISLTYKQRGELRFYSTHYVQPQRNTDKPECHMVFLAGYNLTNSYEAFQAGATAYWNAREWAKERRDAAIARANRVVAEQAQAAGSASWR